MHLSVHWVIQVVREWHLYSNSSCHVSSTCG